MTLLDHMRHTLKYDDWANRQVLQQLTMLNETAPQDAVRLLNHIVGTRIVWLARLRSQEQPCPVWPSWPLSELAAQLHPCEAEMTRYIDSLNLAGLHTPVAYTNSKGERFESTPYDVLTHVVLHGAYHRGQIARVVRQSGHTPEYTDYIHAARQGHIPD